MRATCTPLPTTPSAATCCCRLLSCSPLDDACRPDRAPDYQTTSPPPSHAASEPKTPGMCPGQQQPPLPHRAAGRRPSPRLGLVMSSSKLAHPRSSSSLSSRRGSPTCIHAKHSTRLRMFASMLGPAWACIHQCQVGLNPPWAWLGHAQDMQGACVGLPGYAGCLLGSAWVCRVLGWAGLGMLEEG